MAKYGIFIAIRVELITVIPNLPDQVELVFGTCTVSDIRPKFPLRSCTPRAFGHFLSSETRSDFTHCCDVYPTRSIRLHNIVIMFSHRSFSDSALSYLRWVGRILSDHLLVSSAILLNHFWNFRRGDHAQLLGISQSLSKTSAVAGFAFHDSPFIPAAISGIIRFSSPSMSIPLSCPMVPFDSVGVIHEFSQLLVAISTASLL